MFIHKFIKKSFISGITQKKPECERLHVGNMLTIAFLPTYIFDYCNQFQGKYELHQRYLEFHRQDNLKYTNRTGRMNNHLCKFNRLLWQNFENMKWLKYQNIQAIYKNQII